MVRKAISAPNAAAIGPYSHAVEANGFVFFSGQTPIDPATGKLVVGDIRAQTKQCFANLFGVLEAARLGPEDVTEVRVYLIDMDDFPAMNEIYADQFKEPYPARTTIGCASLPLNARIEIGMVARRPLP
jgi:endoribonuclease L-PSP, putative